VTSGQGRPVNANVEARCFIEKIEEDEFPMFIFLKWVEYSSSQYYYMILSSFDTWLCAQLVWVWHEYSTCETKHGDLTNSNNYRAITISPVMSKIFESCLLSKYEALLFSND